jgi:hypothetical protein
MHTSLEKQWFLAIGSSNHKKIAWTLQTRFNWVWTWGTMKKCNIQYPLTYETLVFEIYGCWETIKTNFRADSSKINKSELKIDERTDRPTNPLLRTHKKQRVWGEIKNNNENNIKDTSTLYIKEKSFWIFLRNLPQTRRIDWHSSRKGLMHTDSTAWLYHYTHNILIQYD